MVPQSDSLPVVKQAAEPLRSVPLSDFRPVVKTAAAPLQSVLQEDPPPVEKPAAEHVELAPLPTVTRSGRIVKRPARFQEFAT